MLQRSVIRSLVGRTVRRRLVKSMCQCRSSSRQVQNDLWQVVDLAAVRADEVVREDTTSLKDVMWLKTSMGSILFIRFGVAVWICR